MPMNPIAKKDMQLLEDPATELYDYVSKKSVQNHKNQEIADLKKYNMLYNPKYNPFMNHGNGLQAQVYGHATPKGREVQAGLGYLLSNGTFLKGKVYDNDRSKPVYGAKAGIDLGLGSLTYADNNIQDKVNGMAGIQVPVTKHTTLNGSKNYANGDTSIGANYNNGNFNANVIARQSNERGNDVLAQLGYRF